MLLVVKITAGAQVLPEQMLNPVCHGEDHHEVGMWSGRNPGFSAVDHIMGSGLVEHGTTTHRAGVATTHRFCQAICSDLLTAGDGDREDL